MRTIRVFLAVLCLALLAPAARPDGDSWPFGSTGMGRGKDYQNLGLIGAKARDADREPPPEMPRSGRRSVSMEPAPATDDGPEKLLVTMLFPDGPAERAGVEPGDVIVGVNGSSFRKGSLPLLAAAITRAESGKKKGRVTLLVRREGEKKTLEIDVEIPQGGKDAAKPTEGKARAAIVAKALDWLAARQEESGGFAETLSGTNGAVVQTSLAGLAWLAGGSDLEKGPHQENVKAALDFVGKNAGKTLSLPPGMEMPTTAGMDQTNWGYAYAAIFLGELHARTPSTPVRMVLHKCGRALAERQEPSGGWAHGPGGPNPLGYTELNIVSGLALSGLGLASMSGYEVPAKVIESAERYLEKSGSGDGGVAYSHVPGQRGMGNIGRTAGAWLGFRTLGLRGRPWCKKMRGYVDRHVDAVLGGHASLMQHVQLAGVASAALGKRARKRFWQTMQRDMVLARAPDGSFQPRPWHESLGLSSNSDVTFGEVWTTASWTIVLASEADKTMPGLPAWTGEGAAKKMKR
ncbi:MAG: DUF6288 domain-containing protein [Planctomycetota bacterium]